METNVKNPMWLMGVADLIGGALAEGVDSENQQKVGLTRAQNPIGPEAETCIAQSRRYGICRGKPIEDSRSAIVLQSLFLERRGF